MNREEAEEALGIIRKVVQNTREDLVARNWGLIWMVHAFTNLAAFLAIALFVEGAGLPILWYLVPLVVVAVVDLGTVTLLARRETGVRSYIEWQLHGIWTTFIAFSGLAAVLLYVSGVPPTLFCPLLALTSGIGFAMMGVIFYRRYFVFAALFAAIVILAPLMPQVQWVVFGLVWWAAMFIPGFIMHRERQARLQRGPEARFL